LIAGILFDKHTLHTRFFKVRISESSFFYPVCNFFPAKQPAVQKSAGQTFLSDPHHKNVRTAGFFPVYDGVKNKESF